MDKKDLVKLIDEIFKPLKFKKKGNNWVFNGEEINKIVNLQKSNFGNYFYLNYGFVIRKLRLEDYMHVSQRLGSLDRVEVEKINNFLDLDFEINDAVRYEGLRDIIQTKIADVFNRVNDENDVLEFLKQRSTLNDIPAYVRKHFNLSVPL